MHTFIIRVSVWFKGKRNESPSWTNLFTTLMRDDYKNICIINNCLGERECLKRWREPKDKRPILFKLSYFILGSDDGNHCFPLKDSLLHWLSNECLWEIKLMHNTQDINRCIFQEWLKGKGECLLHGGH